MCAKVLQCRDSTGIDTGADTRVRVVLVLVRDREGVVAGSRRRWVGLVDAGGGDDDGAVVDTGEVGQVHAGGGDDGADEAAAAAAAAKAD